LQNSKIRNVVLINSYKGFYKTSKTQNKGKSSNFVQLRSTGCLAIFANRGTDKIKLWPANAGPCFRLYSNSQSLNINKNVKDSVDTDIVNSFQNEAITFDSLESGFEAIKFSMLGVPGVYLLENTENPKRFYIGSTLNLARRLSEYMLLTSGAPSEETSINIWGRNI